MRIGAGSEAVLLRDIYDGFIKILNASPLRVTGLSCSGSPVATGIAKDSALHESISAKKKKLSFF
jgi:hypothetical protein